MDYQAIAEKLLTAERQCIPIDPLTNVYPTMTVEDAYRIQLAIVEKKKTDKNKIIGKKIGLTSRAMQRLLNVNEPDYGHLLSNMLLLEGEPCVRKKLIWPRVEGELAFVLKERLQGPGITPSDVLRATEGIMPAFEIVDSRIRDWKIKLPDTVADNGSSAFLVLGSRMMPVKDLDLRLIGMVLEKNGEVVSTGAGAAVWGNPAAAVAWLANKLSDFGIALEAGEIILSGALTAAEDANEGDVFSVSFDRLGTLSLKFV
jgi:2-keto-4-pentenoate hydratase